MLFANHHNMVEAFPSNRADHPLRIRVLPWRAWRNDNFPDVQRPRLTRKSFSIDVVSISDEITRSLLQAGRLKQLACRPFRGRMLRDIEMPQPAPAVGQHHEHEQDPKSRGGY